MKKTFVLLILVLSLVLAGCGGGNAEEVAGTVKPTETTAPATEAPETAATEAPAAETEEATEAPAPQEAEGAVSMGRLEGGTYINDYAGFACDLDSSWSFYSAEELQTLPDNVKELLADTEMGDAMEEFTQFTDMMAENVDMLAVMNVLYQKQGMQERLAFAMLSDEEILDYTLSEKDMMIDAYAATGMMVQTMEKKTVTFLGQERLALHTTGTVQEIPFALLQVFDYHLGQYSVTLSVTTYLEDSTQEVLDLFYPI